jgi:NAD(P)-dependent dehydrogenase (short-subunit alcohol dehydrogenase family)
MELAGRVAVITGGASGIGRALAQRFAQAGAEGVVVADRDAEGAERVAAQIGAQAMAFALDVGDEAANHALIDAAEERFGRVDLFAANAGIGGGVLLGDGFDQALAVNALAHVYAARRLVPGWIERGEGYFLSTASAAGLLSQIGSAQYSMSKHAAVAFAEWLSITYGDAGVRVSCLCPMGVNTPLLNGGGAGAPDAGQDATNVVKAAGTVLEPEQVADLVLQAVRDERFLILPHPEVLTFFQHKGNDYERWIRGMRRLQSAIVPGGMPAP